MWTVFLILCAPLVVASVLLVVLCTWLVYQTIRGWRLKPVIGGYPKVGILVPHFNEDPKYLLQSLDSIEKQEYPSRLTVLLVDDGSTNGIQWHLKAWLAAPRVHEYLSIRFEENNGRKGKAMDAALPHLPESVEALVVVDSDTILEQHSIKHLAARLWQDDRCAAVCGLVIPANDRSSFLNRLQHFEYVGIFSVFRYAQDLFGFVSIMAGAFCIHRMSAVRKVGGWSRWLVEDIAWTWSALAHGYRTGHVPDAIAYTYCPTTHQGFFNQRRRWARGRMEAFRAAWSVSPLHGLIFMPAFLGWCLNLLPPMLSLMPILAVVFEQWWVFGVMVTTYVLFVVTYMLYQLRLPVRLRKSVREIMSATFYNTVIEIFLWRPNMLGFTDEVFGRSKVWMTR